MNEIKLPLWIKYIQVLAPIASAFVGCITLYLAFKINNAYSKRELLKKQIEVVADLIKRLHNSYFGMLFSTFSGNGSSGGFYHLTIFDALEAVKDQTIIKKELFEDNPIYFHKGSNQLFDIKEFIDNPYTPVEIANALVKFYSYRYNSLNIETHGERLSYVIIESAFFEEVGFLCNIREEHRYIKGNAIAFNSWLSFVECSKELRKSIENWFERYNMKSELNIRTDFKSRI